MEACFAAFACAGAPAKAIHTATAKQTTRSNEVWHSKHFSRINNTTRTLAAARPLLPLAMAAGSPAHPLVSSWTFGGPKQRFLTALRRSDDHRFGADRPEGAYGQGCYDLVNAVASTSCN